MLCNLSKHNTTYTIQIQTLRDAVIGLWELAATRRSETHQVLGGEVLVTNKVMSVLIGDIHNFTALGEKLLDEMIDAFLFEFTGTCEDIAFNFNGLFEDQGDGFKVIFDGENHVNRAVSCAASLRQNFIEMRQHWALRAEAFDKIGFGIGVLRWTPNVRQPEPRLKV